MNRAELNAEAERLGVEDPDKLPNMDAVIAAIEQTEAGHPPDQDPPADPEPELAAEPDADVPSSHDDDGAEREVEPDGDRLPLERRESTGEWKCPFCPGPGGSMESQVKRCPRCGATVDGDEVVARVE